MKGVRLFFIPLTLLALELSSCNLLNPSKSSGTKNSDDLTSQTSNTNSDSGEDDPPYTPDDDDDHDWGDTDITGDFLMLNGDGLAEGFTVDGSTYTITTAGTYTLSGLLQGRIIINAQDAEVELDLNGVRIESSENSPIYALKAEELKIKAIKNTVNAVVDNRSAKVSDVDDQYEGAIAGKCDMHFVGKGELQVYGGYNNGIHTSKDLKIKNQKLYSWGYHHAIRGGNSITILNASTYVEAVAKTGDGLHSNDAGVTSKGKQKGTITFSGGTTIINSQEDGVHAAYNVVVEKGTDDETSEETVPTINIYTDKYATLTRPGWQEEGNTDKSATTAKGLKASNEINVSDGKIYIKAYDDGFHANSEELTDSDDVGLGTYGTGAINVSGGNITVDCSDDGMHADGTLTISGGTINVTNSYEGIEGQSIVVTGGVTRAFGKNDGMNAAGDNPSITISGGFTEISAPSSNDVDGIDSNGTYTQTGGIVVCKGPNQSNSAALDHDGAATVTGGTLIALGYIEGYSSGGQGGGPGFPAPGGGGGPGNASFSYSNVSLISGKSFHSKTTYTITIGDATYTISNAYAYGQTICFSDTTVN